ncbi:MAG: carboxypeptidase-like regulatory domain-containing protein [Terracidiphilus sp.]
MLRCPQVRFCLFATSLVLIVCAFTASGQSGTTSRGRKYKSPPPTARIEVTVLRDVNGKPIENAAVVFHPMEGERDKGSMELKTNEDGKTVIDVLPIGDTVRLQIIAKGFQTYGEDFKVEKSEMAFEIRMKRPGEQYSIYKDHGQSTDAGKDPHGDKPEAGNDEGKAGASPNAPAAPASKDKPAPQPDAQSSPSQSQPPK